MEIRARTGFSGEVAMDLACCCSMQPGDAEDAGKAGRGARVQRSGMPARTGSGMTRGRRGGGRRSKVVVVVDAGQLDPAGSGSSGLILALEAGTWPAAGRRGGAGEGKAQRQEGAAAAMASTRGSGARLCSSLFLCGRQREGGDEREMGIGRWELLSLARCAGVRALAALEEERGDRSG